MRHTHARGMVTVELAFASLFVVMAAAALAWVLGVLMAVDRCQLAADEVARQAARRDQAAMTRVIDDVPAGATVEVSDADGEALVAVRYEPSVLGVTVNEITLTSRVLKETRA